jgi:hypothetical protein
MIHEIVKPDILKPYVEPKVEVNEVCLNYNIDFFNNAIKNNVEQLSKGEYVSCKLNYRNNNEIHTAIKLFKEAGWIIGYTSDLISCDLNISIKRDLTKK